jgi:hypothetical protein
MFDEIISIFVWFFVPFALVVGFDKLAAWNRSRRRKRNGANAPR